MRPEGADVQMRRMQPEPIRFGARARRWVSFSLLVAASVLTLGWMLGSLTARAQSSADDGESSSKKPDLPPPKDKTVYNPLPAQEDIEVGTFYMHKGDIDAAIPRFEDAIRLQPNLAKPRLLLADAYEKKGDKATAVKYYREYLQVYPTAPDAKKVQKKIDKLSREGG
jgi:tetratricopeptide (TPR) repeat protein